MKKQTFTICSVSFNSKDHLNLNWDFTTHLNPNQQLDWLIIENSSHNSDNAININDDRFHVCTGYEFDTDFQVHASYHHSLALNKAIKMIETRFILFLDPDFYIVRTNWIDLIISYMEKKKLAFFGAPWHPKWYVKYRYFPCVHCLFIDLDKVLINSIDFLPGNHLIDSQKENNITESSKIGKRQNDLNHTTHLRKLASKVNGIFLINARKIIGSSSDTGYLLFNRFHKTSFLKSEYTIPVYRVKTDFLGPQKALSLFNRVYELFLLDNRSFIPKRPGYFSNIGFKELGYPDTSVLKWEEFIWKDKPFGFHIRRYGKTNIYGDENNPEQELSQLQDILLAFKKQQI